MLAAPEVDHWKMQGAFGSWTGLARWTGSYGAKTQRPGNVSWDPQAGAGH